MITVLAVVLALAVGWCWGHSTARVRHVPIGALAADDQAALDAGLDLPDDPRNPT